MYKTSLFLLCALAGIVSSALTPEEREEKFRIQNECMKETGATDEMIMNAFAGKFTDAPELGEQMICVGRREGIIDADGNVHREILKSNLMTMIDDEAKIDAVLDKCMIVKATLNESAIASCKCMFGELHG